MASIFKNIGKGVGYFFAFPFLLVAIALYAVFGLVVFIIQFFKLIVLFFTGRTLFSDLPEDIELRAKMTKDEPKVEANPEQEQKEENNQLSLYPSDSVVYGAGYSSPLFNKEEERVQEPEAENKVEEEPAPEVEKENDLEKGENI